ncbi:hypothetical protein Taro_026160 [Colocasia esculenta]|uniref:Uncharacterized protein n=1 Tax=Colocasia esculenta TaxID=4460 RepID=A0A843VC53_COLES|nr:hypothetical protein [Colocasia esculenta]
MFTRLFGKPKEEANALTTIDKLNETLEMLEKKEGVLLKKVTAEVERAKEFTRAKNKRASGHAMSINLPVVCSEHL